MVGRWGVSAVALAAAFIAAAPGDAQTRMFYSQAGPVYELYSLNRDATDKQPVLVYPDVAYNGYIPWMQYLKVDSAAGKLYYTAMYTYGLSRIERINLDGFDREVLVPWSTFTPGGIVIDPDNEHLYWISQEYGLRRQNFDGTNPVTLVGPALGWWEGLAADLRAEYIFWIHDDRVMRANLDGSGVREIIPSSALAEGDLEVDPVAQRIYWMGVGGIHSAKYNGSDVQYVVASGEYANDFEIDLTGRRIYWHTPLDGVVKNANLDGSDIQSELFWSFVSFALDNGLVIPPLPGSSSMSLLVTALLLGAIGALRGRRRQG